ncbi:hypothetical protein PNEG_00756 [Pneumocystis murina B123]|uniref:UNC-45/Cro1/She4 central domain-containing protein n=1 Tax=Pneumocystis murina (strain B123) TaxID=1069680 RepID=M7NVI9_PNEMU|nr:hypothetical protein PNEG_00756 [Pneumocystis murina B123]EMR11161.1 hypothetical protein PNEG_00756 [Pneumocystis murina B123]
MGLMFEELEEISKNIEKSIDSRKKVDLLIRKSKLYLKLKKVEEAVNILLEGFYISPDNEEIRILLNELNKEFEGVLIFSFDFIKAILLNNSRKCQDQEIFNYFLGPNQDLRVKKFIENKGIFELMEGFSKSLYILHFYLVGRLILMLCSLSDLICESMINYIISNEPDIIFLSKVPDTIIQTIFLVFCKKSLWPSTRTWEFSLQNFFNSISKEIKESKKERQITLLKGIHDIFSLENEVFRVFCNSSSLYSIFILFGNKNDKDIRKLSSLLTFKLIKQKKNVSEKFLENFIFNFIIGCFKEGRNETLIGAYSILTYLFTIDSSMAVTLFLKDGFLEEISSDIKNDNEVNLFLLEMISSSCINIDCRKKLLEIFMPVLNDLKKQKNIKIYSLSKIIIIKLTSQTNKEQNINKEDILNLAKNLVLIISQDYNDTNMSFIEGLAYVSMFSHVKEYLASEEKLFIAISERVKKEPSDINFIYPAFVSIKNIVNYKSELTEEQKQIIKLKSIAQGSSENSEDILESNEKVTERCFKIINYQMSMTLNLALSCHSDAIKTLCSKIILSFSIEKKHRIILAKQGVIRILYNIIKDYQTKTLSIEDSENNFLYPAIISLVKILITVNPNLIFDRSRFQVDDLIKPIYECLKISENDNSIVQFECLLALTNLASMNIEIREKLVSILWPMIELLWLSNNELIQRSTIELICNLVACPSGVAIFKKNKQRVHILLALADSPDKNTRSAAGGALAILSDDLSICKIILEKENGIKIILDMINEDVEDLIHRGLVCIANIIYSLDFKDKVLFERLNIIEDLYKIIKKTENKEIIDLSYQIIEELQKKIKYIN